MAKEKKIEDFTDTVRADFMALVDKYTEKNFNPTETLSFMLFLSLGMLVATVGAEESKSIVIDLFPLAEKSVNKVNAEDSNG